MLEHLLKGQNQRTKQKKKKKLKKKVRMIKKKELTNIPVPYEKPRKKRAKLPR